LEAAVAELHVSSELDKALTVCCQPVHIKAPLLPAPICSLDRCESAAAQTEEAIRGSQMASHEAKRDFLPSLWHFIML